MRILSWQELRQAAELPEEKPTGLFSRRSSQPSGLSPEERRRARAAAATLEHTAKTYQAALDMYGVEPFDLSAVARFLRQCAILDEAATFHRLFPEERDTWMPTQALLRYLAISPKETEGRILLQRLWLARSVFLTIELAPSRDGCEWLQGTVYLALFFGTDNLLECCS